jgi:Family of unknown function (DUF6519)/Right handed beta helix region
MGADVSRVRFDPLRDYAGVVLQQGRLLLDGDFNDYVTLLDRRLRAETSDLTSMGPDPNHAGVAWVPRQTPEGFHVTATGGVLSIGRGRMYVDGLLAENHGIPPAAFDPLLSEPTGSADTPYLTQPYWPTPDPVPDGTSLAYLDVWEREVTHLEAPELVEVAVGVDTTARWQTAWQVRLLPNGGNASCSSDDKDIPGWLDLIQPSAGRLTTGTIEVAPTDDPCELPPTSGYRGRENQTYRVEIHSGGAPGTATFKWSRDNGSVATSVTEMVSPTVLRLASVGRDDVLRVSTGNWVEILDDHYELGQKPGVIRKVTVDDAARTITFTGALPADLQPANAADAAARHLRVRRWDQSGIIRDGAGTQLTDLDAGGSTGLVSTPAGAATQVVLEDGVVVSFSVAAGGSGTFRAGDHWIFAARTADTSIEILTEAPPVGVHHHYARLGFATPPDSDSDCRRLWPPLQTGGDAGCDCTVCVTPDSHAQGVLTVQAAIDQVKETGGTVCLATGVYDLGDGVFVDGARSVRIHGQGPATILVGRGTALTVTRSLAITVDNLAIVSGRGAPAGVRLRSVLLTNLRDLVVLSYGGENNVGSAVELSGIAALVGLENNVLVGQTAVDAGGSNEKVGVVAAGLRVTDNVLVGFNRGVDLGGLAAYLFACRVQGNEVLSGQAGGVVATGAVAPGGSLAIVDNKVATSGTGIAVGSDAIVTGNVVNALLANRGPDGIVVTSGGFGAAAGNVTILGNRVHDRTGTGIALRIPVRTFMVKQNIITSVAAGIAIEGHGAAERVAIDNNEILDVVAAEDGVDSVVGIAVTHAQSVAVVGNTVNRVAPKLVDGTLRAGILVTACPDVRVGGNVVGEIGPPDGFIGLAAGVVVVGPFDHVSAAENSVRFGAGDAPPNQGQWHALLIQSAGLGQVKFGGGKAVIATTTGAFVLTNLWAYLVLARADHVGVTSNQLSGGGDLPTCLVQVNGDVVADANQCTHLGGERPGMFLSASSVIATSNRVRGDRARLTLDVPKDRFAAVANITAGGTELVSAPGLFSPWDALNPVVN